MALIDSSFLEAGYIYVPYIPLQVTPVIMTEQPEDRAKRAARNKRVHGEDNA